MEQKLNPTVVALQPSGIRKFFELATSMKDVLSLGVGEPDFDTPWYIREEAIHAIETGKTFYTPNAGLLELRHGITNYLKEQFDVSYTPEEMIVTVGGSQAIDLVLRAICKPNDEIIVCTPAYVAYEPCILLAQAIPVFIELKEEHQFKLQLEDLQRVVTKQTKGIILNYPSNPTGGIMLEEDYETLVNFLYEHQIFIITDEIYAELTYEQKHFSISRIEKLKKQVIYISGFSKAYAMTGWRLGYVCAPSFMIDAMLKIHQYTIMCPPTISQFAAIKALENGQEDVAAMRESFLQRRNYLVHELRRIGFAVHVPQGAFYVFPNIEKICKSSQIFCEDLLQEERVALVPGTAFGSAGEGFVRISYAYSIEEIKEALVKIERFVERRLKKADAYVNCINNSKVN